MNTPVPGRSAADGITVNAVMTDTCAPYHSKVFAAARDGIRHRRARAYQPITDPTPASEAPSPQAVFTT